MSADGAAAVVLDTHAWIWWASDPALLSAKARKAIAGARIVGVPAISCWEVAMLCTKGRLKLDRDVGTWVRAALALPRVMLLELSPEVAVAAAKLAELHGDPADRMIAATAMELGAPLVTKDAMLARFVPVHAIW